MNTTKEVLTKSSMTEQRSLLKPFIERIDVDDTEVYYTIPVPPKYRLENCSNFIFCTPRLKERGIKWVK